MSLSETQAVPACACEDGSHPYPATTPRLPVLHVCSERQLDVIYSEREAIEEACERPEDAFYDARGILLSRVVDHHGHERLEACAEADPDTVRDLMWSVLHTAFEDAGLQGEEAEAGAQLLAWLDKVPTLVELMYASMPTEPQYLALEGELDDGRCRSGCSWIERMRKGNNCCPAS